MDKIHQVYKKAEQYWRSTFVRVCNNPRRWVPIFRDLVARYGEPHRAYHNLEHIVTMFEDMEVLGDTGPFLEVSLGIWFHDAVYDPRSDDNEARSAELARTVLSRINLKQGKVNQVCNLVLATKHGDRYPDGFDAGIICDLDLAILGKSADAFAAYEAGIRKEYDWVPYQEYVAKRIKVLEMFLNRRHIFSHSTFRGRFESRARRNLELSIQRLRLSTLA